MALNLPLSPHLSARFGADATGELTVDGAPEWFAEESTQRLREVVLRRVGDIAASVGHPVQLMVSDDEGDWLLAVHPDGTIDDEEELPPEVAAAPAVAASSPSAGGFAALLDPAGSGQGETSPGGSVAGGSVADGSVGAETSPAESPRDGVSPGGDFAALLSQTGSSAAEPSPADSSPAGPVALLPQAAPGRESFLYVEKPRPDRARRGVRGALARAGIPLEPSAGELRERAEIDAVSRHWAGPRTIAIVNGKGGANKTPTTALLSAVFARNGGSGVLAWDNNETRGTLGWRTEQDDHDATVQSLLPATASLLSAEARTADIGHFVHHQNADKYDVLRSNPTMLATEQRISSADFDLLHTVATKFYRLVFIDSGNDESAERWLRMIDHTDQLVIATTALGEHAEAGALLLEALLQRDANSARLARDAVVIVSQSERTGPASDVRRVAAGFEPLARRAVTIPFDPEMHGGRLAFDTLAPRTRRAWLHAAAAVAEGL